MDRINQLDAIIRNREEEYKRLVALASGLGALSLSERVQSSRDLHGAQNTIARYIDLEREIDRLKAKRQELLSVIESLPTVEYKIIDRFYLQDVSLKVIACDFHRSYDWAKKNKRKALEHLQSMIDGE